MSDYGFSKAHFAKIEETEMRIVADLKKVAKEVVKEKFDLEVSRLKIDEEIDDDGDDLLLVKLVLKKSERKLPCSLFFYLINHVAEALLEVGERRHAIILPYLSRGQQIAKR